MNTLSWILYFAGIIDSLKTFLGLISFFSFVLWAGSWIVNEGHAKAWFGISCVLFGLFASLTPTKNTVYAIAASEIGETVIHSEVGKKASKAIELWIDSQIEKNTPKK